MNKFSKFTLSFILISWGVLAIIFGIYDLEISIAIVNESSAWGQFGRDFGESPGWGLIFTALAITIGSLTTDIKKQKIGGVVMVVIGVIMLISAVFDNDFKKILDASAEIISVSAFTLLTFKKDWRQYRKFAGVIVVLALINVLLFVQTVKILWGRVRFRDLNPDFFNYTPWYVPNGITGNHSFPSGHASMGFIFLPFLILLRNKSWKNPRKILGIVLIIGWGVFVAVSRVILGAHYCSDVLFSSEMAALITLLLYNKFYSNEVRRE
ncbi:MAG: phosphatase PAP2 family protein [Promethearchaeota archaeon]